MIKRFVLIVSIAFHVVATTKFCFGQNHNYSLREIEGFCYSSYSYNGKDYPVCYGRPNLSKTLFHFNNAERRHIIVLANRYSPSGMDKRTLVLDTRENLVREIDSCPKNDFDFKYKKYFATSGDTIYA